MGSEIMFRITESAHKKLINTINQEKTSTDENLYLRLSMGIGWGGPKLNLSLEERKIQGDLSFEFDNLIVIIHEKDFVYFDHTKLDYVKDVLGNSRFQLLKV